MIKLYFIPVWIATYASVSPDDIRKENAIIVTDGGDIDYIYKQMDKENKRAYFSSGVTRLLIEPANGKPLYLIDQDGNVRRGTQEYQLTPRAFMGVHELLVNNYLLKRPPFDKKRC